MKRIKTLKRSAIILLIMGVAFLIASIFIFNYVSNFVSNGEETTATIVSITITGSGEDTNYHVEVEYYVNNVRYSSYLNQYHSGMKVGQEVPIIYMPNDPSNIIYGENVYFGFWVFMGVGLLFLVVGCMLLVKAKRKSRDLCYQDENNVQINKEETNKPSYIKYIILSLPVIGFCYAGFRMLILINEHYDVVWSFFGKKFWKFWFSCACIMVVTIIINIPMFILTSLIAKLENNILLIIFSLLILISMGYCLYFLTNYVVKKTKSNSE